MVHAHGFEPIAAVFILAILFVVLIVLGIVALVVAAWCMIFKRAGYPWAMGLLSVVPIANFVIVLFLAFSKWPVEREVEELKSLVRHYMPGAPPAGYVAPSAQWPAPPAAPAAPTSGPTSAPPCSEV
jgi:hypothetical protein